MCASDKAKQCPALAFPHNRILLRRPHMQPWANMIVIHIFMSYCHADDMQNTGFARAVCCYAICPSCICDGESILSGVGQKLLVLQRVRLQ